MTDIIEFNKLILQYPIIFNRLLDGYSFVSSERNMLTFCSENGDMEIIYEKNAIAVTKKENKTESVEFISFPLTDDDCIKSIESITEVRERGKRTEKIERSYDKIDDSDNFYLTSINSKVKVRDREHRTYSSEFASYRKKFIRSGSRWGTDRIESSVTYLNNSDISRIFGEVDGPDRIERIYDLYMGRVSPKIYDDLLSINLGLLNKNAFDYRTLIGITPLEENMIGNEYKPISNIYLDYFFKNILDYEEDINLNSRNAVIKVLVNHLSYEKSMLEHFQALTGYSYADFGLLRKDVQEEILKRLENNNVIKIEKNNNIVRLVLNSDDIYRVYEFTLNNNLKFNRVIVEKTMDEGKSLRKKIDNK